MSRVFSDRPHTSSSGRMDRKARARTVEKASRLRGKLDREKNILLVDVFYISRDSLELCGVLKGSGALTVRS